MDRFGVTTLPILARRLPVGRGITLLPMAAAIASLAALIYLLAIVGASTLAPGPDNAIIARFTSKRQEPSAIPTVDMPVEMGLAPAAGPGSAQDQASKPVAEEAEPDRLPDPNNLKTDGGVATSAQADPVGDGLIDDQVLTDIIEVVQAEKEKLAVSRAELELREQSVRELIRIAEQRLAQMEALASRLEALLGRITEDEEARIQTLVSLYQSMKPKEAARIFDQLELPVLLQVARRMRETKLAPIVAAMQPEKARELTRALSQPAELLQRE